METRDTKPAKSFKDLRVWQSAYGLTIDVYKLCATFLQHEKFGLVSQMTRAAISVCSNISEGFGRRTANEKGQFYSIANGSLNELENQLLIAHGVGYMTKNGLIAIADKCASTHKMLSVLQKVNKK